MTDYNNEDDLGVDGGNSFFDEAAAARRIVQNWTIRSVGNRPRDYMVRDLLFGSLERDARTWIFKKICKEQPTWIMANTGRFSKADRRLVVKYRALHFQYMMHMIRMYNCADATALPVIKRLENCWPTTAEVQWSGDGQRTQRDLCGYARHCPFCFGRHVLKLYDRLIAGPFCEPNNSFVLLGVTSIMDLELDDQIPTASVGERCRFVRDKISGLMRQAAKLQGAEGGLVVFQVGPQLAKKPIWSGNERAFEDQYGFAYRIAILGEVPAVAAAQRHAGRMSGETCIDNELAEINQRVLRRADWQLTSAATAGSLRRAIFGYSPSSNRDGKLQQGLFSLQPWILANYDQWQEHLEAIKGLRLFDTWGSWKGSLPASQVAPQPRLSNALTRRGAHRGRQALRTKNSERHDAAEASRNQLLAEIEPILQEVLDQVDGAPGRVRLRQMLNDRGVNVTDREARWLLDHLPVGNSES